MSRFRGEVEGIEVTVSFWNGHTEFRCELLDKHYSDFDAIERAVKAKLLAMRKDFSNTTAYMKPGWGVTESNAVRAVTVTSVDENSAWIKGPKGKREKVMLESLFESKDQLSAILAREKEVQSELAELWRTAKRWEPRP